MLTAWRTNSPTRPTGAVGASILGGSPPKQLEAIRQLTRPTLSADPPADIVGVDWNGLHRGAQFGEFWTTDGWDDSGRDADHVTVWRTVRHSLARIREFWKVHGIWPETTPQDEGIHIEYGADPNRSRTGRLH